MSSSPRFEASPINGLEAKEGEGGEVLLTYDGKTITEDAHVISFLTK